jgi:hypothetical protein
MLLVFSAQKAEGGVAPKTHTKRKATQHDCLPSLLDDKVAKKLKGANHARKPVLYKSFNTFWEWRWAQGCILGLGLGPRMHLEVCWPYATPFFSFIFIHAVRSFINIRSPLPFFLIGDQLSGRTSLWSAEPGVDLGSALQQAAPD